MHVCFLTQHFCWYWWLKKSNYMLSLVLHNHDNWIIVWNLNWFYLWICTFLKLRFCFLYPTVRWPIVVNSSFFLSRFRIDFSASFLLVFGSILARVIHQIVAIDDHHASDILDIGVYALMCRMVSKNWAAYSFGDTRLAICADHSRRCLLAGGGIHKTNIYQYGQWSLCLYVSCGQSDLWFPRSEWPLFDVHVLSEMGRLMVPEVLETQHTWAYCGSFLDQRRRWWSSNKPT